MIRWPLVSQLQFTSYHFTLDLSTYESRVIMMQNIEMILRGIITRSVHEIRSILRVIYKSPLGRVYYKKLVKVTAAPKAPLPPREQSSLKKTETLNKPYQWKVMFSTWFNVLKSATWQNPTGKVFKSVGFCHVALEQPLPI